VPARADASGGLKPERRFRGIVAGHTQVTGTTKLTRLIAGDLAGVALVDGKLRPIKTIRGLVAALSSVEGMVRPTRRTAGRIEAVAVLNGRMLVDWVLKGRVDAKADPRAHLKTLKFLRGEVIAVLSTIIAKLEYAEGPDYLDAEITLRRAAADLNLEPATVDVVIDRLLSLQTTIERAPEAEVPMRGKDGH
jgi:hypothetical protein